MSGGRNSETSAIVALALALHHSPPRHAELIRGGATLPPSVGVLLRLAGGAPPQEMDPELATLAPPSELRSAALFFIEQVLFQRDADHYRLLGLSQGATPEQVKEHHRLLMRLFHPDRERQTDERKEQFATRANLAYNTLRDADSRARYDDTLKLPPPGRMQTPRYAQVMARHQVYQPGSFWAVRVHPLLMRYLPQWVLAGTALVSVIAVSVVYLFNPPVHLQQAEPALDVAEIAAKPESPETVPYEGLEAAAQFGPRIADVRMAADMTAARDEPATAPPAWEPVRESMKTADLPRKPMSVTPVRQQPAPLIPVTSALKLAAAQVGNLVVVRKPALVNPQPAGQAAAVPQPAAEPARPGVAAAVSALPAEVPLAPPPQPELPDPNTLLARFLEAYEKGDMQACMAFLDEGMQAKSELRREYDALFRSTDLRHIKILNINWSREGDSIRGEGQYRSTIMRKGETVLKSQFGQIRVGLIRRGSTAMINELQFIANNRS